jgi:hypothetical protein
MPCHYGWRRDLSKYTLKSFDSADEFAFDTNNGDLLTYDANGTNKVVVDTTSTQTLTNKTLTSPTITNPTISNPTVSGAGQMKVATVDLTGATWNTGNGTALYLSWTNPEAVAVIVQAVTIYETAASSGVATAAVGTTTTNNHTTSDNLIDDFDLQTTAPASHSTYNKVDTEQPSQQLAVGGFVTFKASADPTGFAGTAFIHYFTVS